MKRRRPRGGFTTRPHKAARPLAIFRYPGGKTKLLPQINRFLWLKKATTYIEPFVGGGSVALAVAQANPNVKIVLNDRDPNIHSFWKVVASDSDTAFESLIKSVQRTHPTVSLFRRLKANPGETEVESAFTALYINRTAFGGNARSGPLGGYDQKGTKKICQRWNAPKLVEAIRKARSLLFGRTTVLNEDFERVISLADEKSFIYLDPPYYKAGNQLYTSVWTDADHERLAAALRSCNCPWSLSYDLHPKIIRLIVGKKKGEFLAGGTVVSAFYSISKRKHREVLYICRPDSAKPQVRR
jgi:DNA adenine methylase